VWRAYAGARFFNGKLEQTWKRFEQIVRHRVALVGLAQPGSGKRNRWTPTSVLSGILIVRNYGCSSAIREQDADRCRSMRGACVACVWKPPDLIAKAVASTSCASWIVDRAHAGSLAAGIVSSHVVGLVALAPSGILYPSWATPARMTRVDRRDKSIFRLGRIWLLDMLRRAHTRASLKHCLPFQKTNIGWRFA